MPTGMTGRARGVSPLRRRIEARIRGLDSIDAERVNRDVREIPPYLVYNEMPAVTVDKAAAISDETARLADDLFEQIIQRASTFRNSKKAEKQAFFRALLAAVQRAQYEAGCLRFPRGFRHSSKAELQVVDAAVEGELLFEHRSPPGSPKMSRYLPLFRLAEAIAFDPAAFDRDASKAPASYVVLRRRIDKAPMEFDPTHPVAADAQRRLCLLNGVNGGVEITVERYCRWEREFRGVKRLCPVHSAVFTDDFDHHGRLYMRGPYGHQSLPQFVRRTIEFDGQPSLELDFGGLHPRLLYHLAGLDYDDDPYALWPRTTRAMRLIAKKVINALINAKSASAALSACNRATMQRAANSAKKRSEASLLRNALRETGLAFKDVIERAVRHHNAIRSSFGTDAGLTLMRIDSEIALGVCTHFARRGVPCLSCHDSFIVPRQERAALRQVMRRCYEERVGFLPVVKD